MDRPSDPDAHHDRIARVEERLRAAAMRLSQAQEQIIVAKERLARARLALDKPETRANVDPPASEE